MSLLLDGINPQAYVGVKPTQPPQMYVFKRSPTSTDAANIGSFWLNFQSQILFILTSVSSDVYIWQQIGAGGGMGASNFITNSGTATQLAGNITIVGDGTYLSTAATGANTVTVSFVGGVIPATKFSTDSGANAIPNAGLINITGGVQATSNIDTSSPGTGDQVFVSVTPNINVQDNLNMNNTASGGAAGVITWGGSRFINNYGTLNTFVGQSAGNTTLTTASSSGNSAYGAETLESLTTSPDNSAFGLTAGNALAGGSGNNVLFGALSGFALTGGSYNTLLGANSGTNYTVNESSNIIIGTNPGVVSENNVIRIGGGSGTGNGQQNKAYLSGVYANATALQAMPNFGVVMSDNTDLMAVLKPTANGQLLIGSAAGGVEWATLTAGSGVNISNNANAITITATGSGSGTVSFVTDSGTATETGGNINVNGTTNQIATSAPGAASTVKIGLPTAIIAPGSLEVTTTLQVASMGYGALISSNTGAVTSLNGTTGQVLTATTGGAVTWTTPATGGLVWNVETANTNMLINNGYAANGVGRLTFTLPAAAAVGNTITVTNLGGSGWTIAQNAGQNIQFATATTTTGAGGSLSSTNIGDTVTLVCLVTNNEWQVISSIGNAITVV